MSTGQTLQIESTSLEATLELAAGVGARLKGGEVIELISDLGGGKTAFVRGLATGIGSNEPVRSPSFTISNQYQGESLVLYHFDFYRLAEPGIMKEELAETLENPKSVVVVEWADIVERLLPDRRLTVKITVTGEESRSLQFTYPGSLSYLFPANS